MGLNPRIDLEHLTLAVRKANRANDAKLLWHSGRRTRDWHSLIFRIKGKGDATAVGRVRVYRSFRGRRSLNIQRFREGGIANESQRGKERERQRESESEERKRVALERKRASVYRDQGDKPG